ncbi:MAG: CpsB/CapC family capsule biosynthesis tyrosine phosphatase [Bacteroidia bacterium]
MGFFSNVFSKSTKTDTPVDLSQLGCDVHSHLIPGIDDGAQTMDDSINLIKELYHLGFKKIITTPHTMSDFYRNTSETILGGMEKVRVELKNAGIPVQLEAASEYYLDYDFEQKIEKEPLLTFGKKKYLLFELSFINPPDNLYQAIFNMQMKGYKPVLAHPERYNYWHRNFSKYEDLIEKGVLLQVNLSSLAGYYSPETKKIAEQMIEKNMISLLGTDCHHERHVAAAKNALYEKSLHQLVQSGLLLNKEL